LAALGCVIFRELNVFMRPKIVILTLVVAFGVLGLIALLKGMMGNPAASGDQNSTTTTTTAASQSQSAVTNGEAMMAGGIGQPAAPSEQLRAAVIEKEIEEIQNLQSEVDGTNNPFIITALLDKMSNSELEVRKAALEALKELNDTNAIPGLEKIVAATTEPREKVAVMDVVDYLNLPSATPAVQPDDYSPTNELVISTNSTSRLLMRHQHDHGNHGGQQASQPPPATSAPQ
jgi:hypothetical protein